MYLVISIVPHASFETSIIQQKLGDVLLRNFLDSKKMIEGIIWMDPVIKFLY